MEHINLNSHALITFSSCFKRLPVVTFSKIEVRNNKTSF